MRLLNGFAITEPPAGRAGKRFLSKRQLLLGSTLPPTSANSAFRGPSRLPFKERSERRGRYHGKPNETWIAPSDKHQKRSTGLATTPTRKQPILKNAAPERLRQRPGAFHCNERTLPFISDLEDVARVSVSTKVAATIDGSLLETFHRTNNAYGQQTWGACRL